MLLLHTGRPYQTELLGPLMDMITPGSTVVDVGGNLGSFTAFFAAAAGLQGRVYSFEPQNKMFQVLLAVRRCSVCRMRSCTPLCQMLA
jgi:predicted methyltransferase